MTLPASSLRSFSSSARSAGTQQPATIRAVKMQRNDRCIALIVPILLPTLNHTNQYYSREFYHAGERITARGRRWPFAPTRYVPPVPDKQTSLCSVVVAAFADTPPASRGRRHYP